jgi:hypothetical protein
MNPIAQELVSKLEADPQLNFKKKKGKYLSEGTCPNCGKAEAFISKREPWLLSCNRANNCGYSESTRERYAELFESFTERYPVTEDDPDAPARAYLTYNRGFRATKVSGWYAKGIRTLFKDRKRIGEVLTVRFPLWAEHYWERIIDRKDIERNGGKKAHISYGCDFKSKGWTPPEQVIEKDDWVFITEGIFKSIALIHLDPADLAWPLKTIAALSSSNLPRDFIELHKGKGITWVLAYDNDPAGLKAMLKYKGELNALGEKVKIALGNEGRDWDDEWRAGKLGQRLIDECLWNGAVTFATSVKEAAFWHQVRYLRVQCHRFSYGKALYRAKLTEAGQDFINEHTNQALDKCWARNFDLAELTKDLSKCFEVTRIANCKPTFLYIQKDRFTKEQTYFFKIQFFSGNPTTTIAVPGTALESPAALHKTLLRYTPGGTFDGNPYDLQYLREQWFSSKITEVQTLTYAGYDKDSGAYIFPDFGYYKGQRLELTDKGYLKAGDRLIKTQQRLEMTSAKGQLDWGGLWLTAFKLDGMALMSWWLGTFFAEQIRARYQSWTFFELTGEWGAGKSTMIELMWRACGIDAEEGIDPQKSSPAARARLMVQLSNLPTVLIEGDREGETKSNQHKFHFDELKTAYNGRSMRSVGVATQDANTHEMPFKGGICISQNMSVDGSDALIGRLVHCHATRKHHSNETYEALKQLLSLPTAQLATFLDTSLKMESVLLEAFAEAYERILAEYKQQSTKLTERLLKNHAQVAAWGAVLPLVFDSKQIPKHWVESHQRFLLTRAQDRQKRLNGDHPLVESFWEIYEAENDKPEYNLPAYFNHSKNPNRLAINLVDFEQKCRQRMLPILDRETLKRLLPMSKRYPYKETKNIRSQLEPGKTKYCWVFMAGVDVGGVINKQSGGHGEDRTE